MPRRLPRRDHCYLIGWRASRLAPHHAAEAWHHLANHLQSLGELDIPKFHDLLTAIRTATIAARQQNMKSTFEIPEVLKELRRLKHDLQQSYQVGGLVDDQDVNHSLDCLDAALQCVKESRNCGPWTTARTRPPSPTRPTRPTRQTRPWPTWKPIGEGLPDADLIVLIACQSGNEPVWFGYWDGTAWLTIAGDQVVVTHWMDLPEAPTHE